METFNITTIAAYVFSALACIFALMVVHTHSILRSAVYLVFVLLCTAVFYILLSAELLAGIQLLVYIGGIVVLIVFVIMLTNNREMVEEKISVRQRILAVIVSAFFFILVIMILHQNQHFMPDIPVQQNFDSANIGKQLLLSQNSGYMLAFEIISLLLLASMIGALVLAFRDGFVSDEKKHHSIENAEKKYQNTETRIS